MPISGDLVNLGILFAEVVGFDMAMDQVTYKPKGAVFAAQAAPEPALVSQNPEPVQEPMDVAEPEIEGPITVHEF